MGKGIAYFKSSFYLCPTLFNPQKKNIMPYLIALLVFVALLFMPLEWVQPEPKPEPKPTELLSPIKGPVDSL